MIVKYKPTGQIGQIPDNKFDPSVFEPAQDPRIKQPQPPPQPSLMESIGQGAIDIGKNIIAPFARTGQNIVSGMAQTPLMLAQGQAEAASTDPRLPEILQRLARKYAGVTEGARKAIAPVGRNESQFQEVSNNPDKAALQQIKDAINIVSYGVPFGKGGNVISKAVLPGAGVGFMQGVSADNPTPQSVVGSTLVGAAIPTAFEALAKAKGALTKGGTAIEEAGTSIRGATRHITAKPSVYGAGKEKDIANALDKMGIRGTAQQQYEQLEPKMAQLGDAIDEKLAANPKPISIEAVKSDFRTNLKSALRLKELTNKQADNEINGYIQDLYGHEGNKLQDTIDSPTFFKLKKMVNDDYQSVKTKIENGATLSPRDKVIQVARKTFDDIIAEKHPDVKDLTLQQSALYDAAPSLSKARFNPPTLRVGGTSLPAPVTQFAQDTGGRTLQNTGKIVGRTSGLLPDISSPRIAQVAGQVPIRLLPSNGGNNVQNANDNIQGYGGNDQASGNLDHTISDYSTNTPESQGKTTLTGFSLERLGSGYAKAIMAGDTAAATQIKKLYDIENAYGSRGLKGQQLTAYINAKSAVSLLDEVDKAFQMTQPGNFGPTSRLTGLGKEAGGSAGLNKNAYTYNAFINGAKTRLAKALGNVGNLNAKEQEDALKLLPALTDTQDEATIKMARLRSIFQSIMGNLEAQQNQGQSIQTTMPDITAQ